MNADPQKEFPSIELRHFLPEDEDAFMSMIQDSDIKEYFAEFNDEDEIIRSKFTGLNTNLPYVQYWGIFNSTGVLIGFASLKKSSAIGTTLKKLEQKESDEVDLDFEEETHKQREKRKWVEYIQAPYAVDIAIHPDHRNKRVAEAALAQLYRYSAAAGLKEIYFEVRPENEKSVRLIAKFNPLLVTPAINHFDHDLYRTQVIITPVPDAELIEELKNFENFEEKKRHNHWRHIVRDIPELTPHRELVMQLFDAITSSGTTIEFHKDRQGCSHEEFFGDNIVHISLKKRRDPISIIWSIAHEYGHLQQPSAKGNELKLYTRERFLREEDAWKKAEEWLKDKTLFIYNWPSFIRFRNRRLEDYLPDRDFQEYGSELEED